jgi:UDP-N-acetylglucosamine 2-epimerase (non-hydrolysing)
VRIVCAVGARPNFVKIAPILRAFSRATTDHPNLVVRLVHTGQHYDAALSDSFFADLEIPAPDIHLAGSSGTHAEQTARVLTGFEGALLAERPDLVIVVGDVNSTLACALAAAKLQVPVAHVEAGLRSRDRTMPEEINRILTDALSELCFTTCVEAGGNLAQEGISAERIHFVGNVMIDSLIRNRSRARRPSVMDAHALAFRRYGVLTLHRPTNVDREEDAVAVLNALEPVVERMPVVFPVHPRSRRMFAAHGLGERLGAMRRLYPVEPLGYLEFLYLMDHAGIVLTDSGGVQEETTVLQVPCLTLRANTERGITVEVGTNRLVGLDPLAIEAAVEEIVAGKWPAGHIPALWDGGTAERIVGTVLGPWAAERFRS